VRAAQPARVERVRRWNATHSAILTNAIIAINVGVFVWEMANGVGLQETSRGNRLLFDYALQGPAVADGEWWRLVTGGFMHASIFHIAFNMIVVFQLGQLLEPALGRVRFGALYFAALLSGSAGVMLLDPNAVTVGASGAAFGLAGAAFVGMRQRGVDVWRTGIGPMIAINLGITFLVPNISIGGHLGGLAGGALVGGVMLHPRRGGRSDFMLDLAVAVGVMVVAVAVALIGANR
jgi:membrane associated rhomboid family serine protease